MFRSELALMTSLLLLGSVPTQAAPLSTKVPLGVSVPAPVKLLRDDPLLQTAVTLDAVEQPLGDVLTSLNPALKLNLTAEPDIADQRVTLHVTGQPAYVLTERLLLLFSHNADHPYGYHWGSLERSAGERPDYQLWRDTASIAQEQEERDYPRRELAVFLREWREMSRLSPKDLAAHRGDYPYKTSADPDDPYNKAFRGLSDDQLDLLANGSVVPLDASLFAVEIAALEQKQHDQIVRQDIINGVALPPIKLITPGQPNPYSADPPLAIPAMRVVPGDKELDGRFPDNFAQFQVHLDGVLDSRIVFDTYDTTKAPAPDRVASPADTGMRVDLTPYLAAKTVTERQRGNLGFVLQALAKAAHINVYEESFLRTNAANGQPHAGLAILKGSVPRLLAEICTMWNYQAQPIAGGYLLWSRTWAQDCNLDVPERLLAPWRRRLAKNGTLGLYDRAEIASSLTWPQVALTLNSALPEVNELDGVRAYRLFNLFGSLSAFEQGQALSPEGLLVSEMSARGQAALAEDYQVPLRDIPSAELAQAVLKFGTEDAPDLKLKRVTMEVDSNGQKLLEGRCIYHVRWEKADKN